MNKLITMAALAGALIAAGIGQAAAANSQAYCQQKAEQAVYAKEHPITKGLIACGAGALIANALTGGNGAATAAGCAGTAAVVTVLGADQRAAVYNDAYNSCMGYTNVNTCPVLTPPSGMDGGYVVGSADWENACAARYKSYGKPGPWQFNGLDGCVHYCNLPD